MNPASLPSSATAELLALAREDLATYAVAVQPKFQLPPHLMALTDRLEGVAAGRIRRLLVSMPPRHGKTLLTSVIFPSWLFGRRPDAQVIFATHSQDFSEDHGRRVRNNLADPLHRTIFPKSRISEDSAAAGKFTTTAGGLYVATGRGGQLTGRGADLLLIDDPLKNREEAMSDAVRRGLHEWFRTDAFTRLQPGGAVVIISTRWHLDDLSGMLLREHAAEGWEVLSLSAIAGPGDPIGRAEGEALWPERYPLEELQKIRALLGGASFASLYQQNPVSAEGAIFRRDWWQRYRGLPSSFEQIVLSADTAFKEGQANDYSVVTVWGKTRTGVYLIHVWRQRVGFPELNRALVSLSEQWRPHAVLIEDRASGQSLIQSLRAETALPVRAVKADTSKTVRASAVTPLIEAGKVFLPESAPWLDAYLNELSSFPAAPHDDMVDSTTQALNYLRESNLGMLDFYRAEAEKAIGSEEVERERELADERRRVEEQVRRETNRGAVPWN